MRVLIADKFEAEGIASLEGLGCVVTSLPDLGADDVPGAVDEHDPDVLVVRSTKVREPVFEKASALQLVVRAGAGYDNIDVEAASSRGIAVANCPGKNAIAVAELAMGLIIAGDRMIADQTAELRAGKWNKKRYGKVGRGLFGRTLGVVGTGHIGAALIDRAKSFGMRIVAWSRSLTDEKAEAMGVERMSSPMEVAKVSDVVSLHVASTAATKHLVDAAFLSAMPDGAMLVNTARGAVVDEAALAKEVESGRLRAAVDVYENQPTPNDSESDIALAKVSPGSGGAFVGTHHCGASTDQSQQAIAEEAVRIVAELKTTGTAPNVVNLADRGTATRLLIVRHENVPGVLAHVIGAIGEAGVNIERMRNVIYAGGKAAAATIRLDTEPSKDVMAKINDASKHVISVGMGVIE